MLMLNGITSGFYKQLYLVYLLRFLGVPACLSLPGRSAGCLFMELAIMAALSMRTFLLFPYTPALAVVSCALAPNPFDFGWPGLPLQARCRSARRQCPTRARAFYFLLTPALYTEHIHHP